MPIYTLYGCTIEVAKGGQSATATRYSDREGKKLDKPETAEFRVIAEPDAPTPQVQAHRWAKSGPVKFAKTETAKGLTTTPSKDDKPAKDKK